MKVTDKIIETELWTSKQRKSSSIHEVSYRACFKAELPKFFIEKFSNETGVIYDPFAGRGTTGIEAALLNRKVILNDINPLSRILSEPRFSVVDIFDIEKRLNEIPISNHDNDIDLSMFFHEKTLNEIISFKKYLENKEVHDSIDKWVRLLVTNRLTGHSSGFLSVYTLPPNQAASQVSQVKINEKRNQKPEYRNIKEILLKKYKSLIRNLSFMDILVLNNSNPSFLTNDCEFTPEINDETVDLIVTSPPFLDIVNYYQDNWLRLWFNNINKDDIHITILKNLEEWSNKMQRIFHEFHRLLKPNGHIAFEVGEVKNRKIKLDEAIVQVASYTGFKHQTTFINTQNFTKTSNIWGVKNNEDGTNTNRIVVVKK